MAPVIPGLGDEDMVKVLTAAAAAGARSAGFIFLRLPGSVFECLKSGEVGAATTAGGCPGYGSMQSANWFCTPLPAEHQLPFSAPQELLPFQLPPMYW